MINTESTENMHTQDQHPTGRRSIQPGRPGTPTARRFVAAVAAGGLLLGACSSDNADSSAPTDQTSASSTTASTAAPSTAAPSTSTTGDEGDDMMGGGMGAMMGASGPACSAVPADGEGSFAGMADDTAATAASNNPLLSTLVTAVVEADLVDTLNSDGPFTIFAPTNDAFAAIPEADLTAILADTEMLTSILTFHVVAGEKLSSEDLLAAGTVTTVNGGELAITAMGDTFGVNGSATSLCMDVPTANATVHIIDAVLVP